MLELIARHRITLVIFSVLILTAATLAMLSFDRIVVYAVSRIYQLDISYSKLEHRGYREFIFRDLKVLDERRGIGTVAQSGRLKPIFKRMFSKDVSIAFHLSGVRFVRKGSGNQTYGTLSGLVYTPFTSRWFYKEISGNLDMSGRALRINEFNAVSDDIKTALKGDVYYNNNLKLDVIIYFSEGLSKNIPELLSSVVLREEPNSWKSLSVKLEGNYKSPSIELSGRLFRLNIGTVSSAK